MSDLDLHLWFFLLISCHLCRRHRVSHKQQQQNTKLHRLLILVDVLWQVKRYSLLKGSRSLISRGQVNEWGYQPYPQSTSPHRDNKNTFLNERKVTFQPWVFHQVSLHEKYSSLYFNFRNLYPSHMQSNLNKQCYILICTINRSKNRNSFGIFHFQNNLIWKMNQNNFGLRTTPIC